jgi:hypothetical protein
MIADSDQGAVAVVHELTDPASMAALAGTLPSDVGFSRLANGPRLMRQPVGGGVPPLRPSADEVEHVRQSW